MGIPDVVISGDGLKNELVSPEIATLASPSSGSKALVLQDLMDQPSL